MFVEHVLCARLTCIISLDFHNLCIGIIAIPILQMWTLNSERLQTMTANIHLTLAMCQICPDTLTHLILTTTLRGRYYYYLPFTQQEIETQSLSDFTSLDLPGLDPRSLAPKEALNCF